MLAITGTFISTSDQESDHHAGRRDLRHLPVALDFGVGQRIRNLHLGSGAGLHVDNHALRIVRQRGTRFEGCNLLYNSNFPGIVFHRSFHGISPLEVVVEFAIAKSQTDEVRGIRSRLHTGGHCRCCDRECACEPLHQVL